MRHRAPSIAELAIVAYCAFQSTDLFEAWWANISMERFGWIAFLIWLLPICIVIINSSPNTASPASNRPSMLIIMGLVSSLVGMISSLNALLYLGLAFALGGLMPRSWKKYLWLIGAISWMPLLGWSAVHFFPDDVVWVRFVIAAFACCWMVASLYQRKRIET